MGPEQRQGPGLNPARGRFRAVRKVLAHKKARREEAPLRDTNSDGCRFVKGNFGCEGPIRTECTISENSNPQRTGLLRCVNPMLSIGEPTRSTQHGPTTNDTTNQESNSRLGSYRQAFESAELRLRTDYRFTSTGFASPVLQSEPVFWPTVFHDSSAENRMLPFICSANPNPPVYKTVVAPELFRAN